MVETSTSFPCRMMPTHPVGHPLHLRQRVAGQEHGPTFGRHVVHQVVELLLDERIETGAGLVEDDQVGAVHERLGEPDLLAVARGVVAALPRQVGPEALSQLVDVGPVDATAQVGEVVHQLLAGEVVARQSVVVPVICG